MTGTRPADQGAAGLVAFLFVFRHPDLCSLRTDDRVRSLVHRNHDGRLRRDVAPRATRAFERAWVWSRLQELRARVFVADRSCPRPSDRVCLCDIISVLAKFVALAPPGACGAGDRHLSCLDGQAICDRRWCSAFGATDRLRDVSDRHGPLPSISPGDSSARSSSAFASSGSSISSSAACCRTGPASSQGPTAASSSRCARWC